MPTLVLLREPLDAIRSYLVFDPRMPVGQAIRHYCTFYEAVLDYRAEVVVAGFGLVTTDMNPVVRAVNARYGTEFAQFANDVQRGHVRVGLSQRAEADNTPVHQLAYPDPSRARVSRGVPQSRIEESRRFHGAERIHAALSELAV